MQLPFQQAPEPRYCGYCAAELASTRHSACAAALELEPPRYCAQCASRMQVQVVPNGWTAQCSRHGTLRQD